MTYQELLAQAKTNIGPKCRVCRECNGITCRGEIPGPGGKGTGSGFIHSYEYLARVKLKMDTLYEAKGQDTSIRLFGREFAFPIFAAPIGAIQTNYSDHHNELSYARAVVSGTVAAGCAAFTGDGVREDFFTDPLTAIKEAGGVGVPTIKPWKKDEVLHKIRLAEEAGTMAIAMDIDAAGLVILTAAGKPVQPKGVAELSEIIGSTKLPFIIKGIMTPDAAIKAAQAGAYGIVVSNHGGRVLDHTPAPCEVLPEIRRAVGDKVKIFVDGAIRTGVDVFKAIALGADAVLIGRPYVVAAFGGDAKGVTLYTKKLGSELAETMIMTGCSTLSDITEDKITVL